MANSIKKHSRTWRNESIHNEILQSVALGSLSTNTTYTMQLPPGEYYLSIGGWTSGNSDGAVNIKVKPYLDTAQTLMGRALFAHEVGSSTVASSIDIASSNTGAGILAEVVGDAGATGVRIGTEGAIPFHNGLAILVDTNTNATTGAALGTLSIEVCAHVK